MTLLSLCGFHSLTITSIFKSPKSTFQLLVKLIKEKRGKECTCSTGVLNLAFIRHNRATFCKYNRLFSAAFSEGEKKRDWALPSAVNFSALVSSCLYSCAIHPFHCGCHINIHLWSFQWTISKWLISDNKSKCNGGTSGRNPAERHRCSLRAKQIKGVSLLVAY